MQDAEIQLLAALEEVASCQEGCWQGRDIEPIVRAVLLLTAVGPTGVPMERFVRTVLDVRKGRLSPSGALKCLFRGDYSI